MSSPRVSVVIPSYNQAEFLSATIRSVLDQTYQDFEIIVVNDASPDNTDEVVKRFADPRIKYIVHEKNQRLPATRNTGMRASQGEIIALLDADVLFHPEKLEAHVKFLDAHPEIGVSYNARYEMKHSAETVRELWRPPLTVSLVDLMLGFPFSPSDTVVRREWAFKVGLFNPEMGSAEDTDFPCRLALAGCQLPDLGRRIRLEEGIEWAARNDVRYIDIQLDTATNAITTFDDARAAALRAACERYGIHLGLHTLSAVNVAEYSPFVSEAMDHYLRSYVDIYPKLGAQWIVVHGGYHFTSDKKMRMEAGLERLKRLVAYAEKKGARVLLENHNTEPEKAEIHYLPVSFEEWRYYFEGIQSPNLGSLAVT